ncbi:unnamed protein product [Cuscuta epithymum]|uniref:U-box domain-containing protein n=1 Tax=Cuscuta epithymum TaxID=186058 RepID=A0AAV0FHG7_9ASTE|nr:unnamed protein product [Cuscuta epithymum]
MEQIIEVPPYFLCPISLEIMRDPVTVSTGITYDRDSIEKWVFSSDAGGNNNNTCPVTKQALILTGGEDLLTPNITLRRYIQSWCTLNASHGVERFPTPKAPLSKSQILKLLRDAESSPPAMQMQCLRRLRSLAGESEANRRSLETDAGVVEFLASVIIRSEESMPSSDDDMGGGVKEWGPGDEALSVLHSLKLSDVGLKSLLANRSMIETLVRAMQRRRLGSSYDELTRAFAVMLLKSMLQAAEPLQVMGLKAAFYVETVQILKDQISVKASRAALQLLITVCPLGRNRVKAVEAGAVAVLVDLLLETASSEKRGCEMILTALDQLSQCAEGRAELVSHPGGLAVVSKKILRVSHVASERGVRILHSVSRFSATPGVVQEMLQLGVAAKLCLVAQLVDCGGNTRTKERAREVLRLHAKSWNNSPCIPAKLRSSFPL